MVLTPAQEQIISDTHRFRVVVCGRKFGKTTLDSEELIGNAICADNRKVMYLAPTLGDARGLMWDRLKQRLAPAIVKENDTRLELKVRTTKGGTSEIFLGSWEKVDSYRGFEYDFLLLDEVQDYRGFWLGWQEALRPTLTPRMGQAMFTGTPKGFNHLYDLFQQKYKDSDFNSFKFSSYDNPHIDRGELEKAKLEIGENRFAQEYLADFRKAEGLVFNEFNRATHVYTEPIRGMSERLCGIDWGMRTAAVMDVDVKDGLYYVSGEVYRSGLTDSDIAQYVAKKLYNGVYPDPESSSGVEELRRLSVHIKDVPKGPGSIKAGISTLKDLLRQNKLFIHESCINLISELESYSYPEKRLGHNESEQPVDEFNHAIDALRYVVDNHSIKKPFRPPTVFKDKTIDIWRGR